MAYALKLDAAAARIEPPPTDLEEIEIRLLLEGVRLRYGYDFREYALSPLRRGLQSAMAREGVQTVSAYQDRLLRDPVCMQRFLGAVGVNVTSLFRDPELVACVREEVVPLLRTYPSVRVWVAGCASGEEAYSLAIVLKEEDLLRRCDIYATDLNDEMLDVARTGTYPLERIRRSADAYAAGGGKGTLSDHYSMEGRTARFDPEISSAITWARHNLVTDGSFNDFHLVVCTNVLIYFRPSLQERAHRLFYDSLIRSGFLAVGRRESLLYCGDREHYRQVRDGVNLFQKMRW